MMSADFFVVPTATCRLLFVLVILAHERRRVVHVAVTDQPTATWTAQQLREAFPWDRAPRYLIRNRDHAFDVWAETAKTMGIDELLTAPHSPWQNAYAERFIGSARRECLDHVIVFSATGLQRLMKLYCAYYEQSRTPLSLNKDAPILARTPRRAMVASWRSRRSADFITDTNGRRPDPDHLTPTSLDCRSPTWPTSGPGPATTARVFDMEPAPFRSTQPHASSKSPPPTRNSTRSSFW